MSKNLLHFDLDFEDLELEDEEETVKKMKSDPDPLRKRFKTKKGVRESRKQKMANKSKWMDAD